jgi:hypothetical protein
MRRIGTCVCRESEADSVLVNEKPALLDQAIEHAFSRQFGLRWVSPIKNHHYQEYKDLEFLTALGMSKHAQKLSEFWPRGGPRWDSLACVESGAKGVLLVEAKSHIPEMYAGECKAPSPNSLQMIDASIARTKEWLGVDAAVNWGGRCQYHFEARMRTVWVYHWYVIKPETGKKVEHNCVVCRVADFPREKGGLNRSTQRWLGVYSLEFQSPRFSVGVD